MKRTKTYFTAAVKKAHKFLFVSAVALMGIGSTASAQIINKIAGAGTYGYTGDGGPALLAEFQNTRGVAVDPFNGFVYISDYGNNVIREIDNMGVIRTIAGTGAYGLSGDGGPGSMATLAMPWGLCVDNSRHLYVADAGNATIRMIDLSTPAHIITRVAGDGTATPGFFGDGGPATSALISSPTDVAVDNAGNLYIADLGNQVIRIVDPFGTINTYAGSPGTPGFGGDGGPAAFLALLSGPMGIATDPAGNLYIADGGNNRIRMVDPMGTISTVAGTGAPGFSGDGGPAMAATFNNIMDVAADASGNIYVGDVANYRVRQFQVGGNIITYAGNGTMGFAGDGGLATAAQLYEPSVLNTDAAGCLYITGKYENRVRKVCPGHRCYDDADLHITSTTDEDGNCIFTANAHVGTTNTIIGYAWSGAGPGVIHHTSAPLDAFTFTLPPGSGPVTISVTVFMVDPDFTDPEAGPCCQAYLHQDVTCEGRPRGKMTSGTTLQAPIAAELAIYPNPTNDAVNIVAGKQPITSVQVIDVNGKKIGDYTYNNAKQVNVSLSKFPPGTYMMRVNNGISKVVTKLK